MLLKITLFFLCFTPILSFTVSDCQISALDDLSPIVVMHNQNEYLYPSINDDSLRFSPGASVDLICAGGNVIAASSSFTEVVTATCIGSTLFRVAGMQVQWRDISCSRVPTRLARYTEHGCENGGREIEIGVSVQERFLRSMLICFDQSTQQALYSLVKIPHSINKRRENTPRPGWLQGTGLFAVTSVTNYYTRVNQRATINRLLGLSEESTEYIQNNNYYLARGHLTARSDTFYPSQQNQTFYLINAAPQWQVINQNNWYRVEVNTRDYAESRKVDLLQWTGVYGVLAPRNQNNQPIKLYLYDINGQKYLPVPEVFWRVVYDPVSQRGVAIIGLNDPYASSYNIFCNDVSSKITWVTADWTNTARGLTYACEIDDFRRTVTFLPTFTVRGLLL
ncbi:salivary endonuclease-like isoform X1 [Rhynchophorus ferrugineus]|uniref:salivary endonuclease-like isoform X1 n=1 Tax=Rhynchophorus ferrugineus TaxID=354439 RepID=UPI003FCCF9B8